jgi:hypothetical protein
MNARRKPGTTLHLDEVFVTLRGAPCLPSPSTIHRIDAVGRSTPAGLRPDRFIPSNIALIPARGFRVSPMSGLNRLRCWRTSIDAIRVITVIAREDGHCQRQRACSQESGDRYRFHGDSKKAVECRALSALTKALKRTTRSWKSTMNCRWF